MKLNATEKYDNKYSFHFVLAFSQRVICNYKRYVSQKHNNINYDIISNVYNFTKTLKALKPNQGLIIKINNIFKQN